MGLRARMALFFVGITVVPLVVVVFVLQAQVRAESRRAIEAELGARAAAATRILEGAQARAGDLASALVARGAAAQVEAASPGQSQAWLEGILGITGIPDRADFAIIAARDGRVVAAVLTPPAGIPGPAAEAGAIARAALAGEELAGAVIESRVIQSAGANDPLGVVVTGVWLDIRLLATVTVDEPGALVFNGRVVAVIGAPLDAVRAAGLPGLGESAPVPSLDAHAVVVPVGEQAGVALWTPLGASARDWTSLLPLLLPAVLAAAILGWFLASRLVDPIREAAAMAGRVAADELEASVEPRGPREVGELGKALNTMAERLRLRKEEVQRSQDELRRSLSRLGQTLSSSLDLNRTLALMVETAMDTLGVPKAVLMLTTPERDALYAKVSRGIGQRVPILARGEGLAGYVAETGRPVRLPQDQDRVTAPVPGEPTAAHVLAVPLMGRGRVIGVLVLLRDTTGSRFTREDLETMRSFAAQASVAIENVLLHQEAQRLSLTDPLTGLWNFRYFQIQADRELESSGRSERPLSVIIVDLDHFKRVNDTYGHQVGDEVLIEVARRLRDSTRVPDVVARYGGEEFVVLLPGADRKGAIATAERIRAAVGEEPIRVTYGDLEPLEVTCSVGVATSPRHGRTVAGLLRSADTAMYTAKSRGRNRVVAAGRTLVVPPADERSRGRAGSG